MLLWINSSENIKLRGPCNAEFTEQGILISNNEWIESIQKYH